ncbi:2-oxoacid:acceptor oxidoreductase family protein [Desulfarculus baarsii]
MKALRFEPLDIVITGVGGQGNVLASQALGMALVEAGYQVTVGETYGLSQRGGAVMSQVRVTTGQVMGPVIPANGAHAVVSLEPLEALRVLPDFGNPQVLVLTNNRPLLPINVISGEQKYPPLDELRQALGELSGRLHWLAATDEAIALGAPILANVIMLGGLLGTGLLPVDVDLVAQALGEFFPPDKMAANRRALARGMALVAG